MTGGGIGSPLEGDGTPDVNSSRQTQVNDEELSHRIHDVV